jgi:hypothetical protein
MTSRLKKASSFNRKFDSGLYLELFLVFAILAIFLIRLFLVLTGYPQLGGAKLHIAHMLWGGLLMLISIFLLLMFIGKRTEKIAAIIGGIGFGTFIDEVGKFVTQDNDYFFQPSVAIIYATFILIVLIVRGIKTGKTYSSREFLLNTLRETEEVVLHDMDKEERDRALEFLDKSKSDEPIALSLRKTLEDTTLIPLPSPTQYQEVKKFFHSFYQKIISLPYFNVAIISFFIAQFIIKLFYIIVLIFFWGLGWNQILDIGIFQKIFIKISNLTFINWAELLSSLVSGALVFIGIWYLRKSKLMAYRMFERSVLLSIFITQVFLFYRDQFAATTGLLFNLLIYWALRFMIEREKRSKSG